MIAQIKAELYKNILMMQRNLFRLFDITIWPIILFFSITLFLRFVNPSSAVLSMAITGLIGWRAVYFMQIESNSAYMDDYWNSNTTQQFAAPLKIVHVIIAGLISGLLKFLIVLAIYLFIAFTFFSYHIPDMTVFIIGVTYLAIVGAIVGIMMLALVILYREKAITVTFMLPDLLVLLSGVYYPITIFPDWLVTFVHILPTFYGFELLKSMVGLGSVDYPAMIICALVWFIAAIIILSLAIKKAKKDGSFCVSN